MAVRRGEQVGSCFVIDRLASGNAEVCRAFSTQTNDVVTLKIFRDERAEVEPVGEVHHPNLATVFETGVHAGRPWLARAFVDGADLDQVYRRLMRRVDPHPQGMPVPLACFVFARVADGIDAAHRQLRSAGGGVHGDLCPEHLLVGFDGSVKVINFRGRPPKPTLAKKVSYSSPEETEGRSMGSRSDVYSLGACLYHLLGGGNVNLGGGAPPWKLDDELQAIVLKALSRAPGARHRWPSELANDLDGYLATSGQTVGTEELSEFMRSLFEQPPRG